MIQLVWAFVLVVTTNLYSMHFDSLPVITWPKPQEQPIRQDHPTITEVQEQFWNTAQGVELVRKHVQGTQASGSLLEGLDIADGRTSKQYCIKIAALLKLGNAKDPRQFVLQETMCTPESLDTWRALLRKKPSLTNKGWSHEKDAALAQLVLKSSRVKAHLKNQHLLKTEHPELLSSVRAPIFSPDYKYVYTRCDNNIGRLFDTQTLEEIYTLPNMLPITSVLHCFDGDVIECCFSDDSTLCFLQQVKIGGNWSVPSNLVALNLKTKSIVITPKGTTSPEETIPACSYSQTARFAVLKPESHTTYRRGLCDTTTKEVLVTFPAMADYKPSNVSMSPKENFCFFNTKEGLKLFDLTQNAKEVTTFDAKRYDLSYGHIHWAPTQDCCLIPHKKSESRLTRPFKTVYTAYYPLSNSTWDLEPSHNELRPVFSPDGRYCFLTHYDPENNAALGKLYDLSERKDVKTFEYHRMLEDELPPAYFSSNPEYPYCFVAIWDKEQIKRLKPLIEEEKLQPGEISKYRKEICAAMRVSLFNYKTQQEVPGLSGLEGVGMVAWPDQGPYCFAVYSHYASSSDPRSDKIYSIDIRKKKDQSLVAHTVNVYPAQLCFEKQYVSINTPHESNILLDVITQQPVCKDLHSWTVLPSGQMLKFTGQKIIELAPADCNWYTISSQQLFLVLYALDKCKKGTPVDLTQNDTKPLRHLFESLDIDMQKYVAKACNIRM